MSWSVSVTSVPPSAVADELRDAKARVLEAADFDSFADDVERQIDQAISCAVQLSDLVGTPKVNVSLYGHASRADTDADSVSVSLSGVPTPPKT